MEQTSSLFNLLELHGISTKKGIAVAINGKVINALVWKSKILLEHDNVLVISATKGG